MSREIVLSLLEGHSSVRKYRDEVVPDDDIAAAVRAAQMAATSSHVQAYSLLRVRNSEKRERLVELTGGQRYVADCGAFFVVQADERRHRLIYDRAEREHARNLETFLVAVIDATLFAQNLVVAIEAMGYGICYIGGLRNDSHAVDELLGIPEHVMPLYGLCVGVPDEEPDVKPRLPLDAVLFDDAYPDDDTMLAAIDRFDDVAAKYYEERGLPGRNWTGGILRKFAKPVRSHLHDYFESKGARLDG